MARNVLARDCRSAPINSEAKLAAQHGYRAGERKVMKHALQPTGKLCVIPGKRWTIDSVAHCIRHGFHLYFSRFPELFSP